MVFSDDWPDWFDAHVALIDALTEYIGSDRELAEWLLDEEVITLKQYQDTAHIDRCKALLDELKNMSVCSGLLEHIFGRSKT